MTMVAETIKDKVKRLSGRFDNDDDELILNIAEATMSHFNRYTGNPDNHEIDEKYTFVIVDVTSRFYSKRDRFVRYAEAVSHFKKFLPILKEEFTFETKGIAQRGEGWLA